MLPLRPVKENIIICRVRPTTFLQVVLRPLGATWIAFAAFLGASPALGHGCRLWNGGLETGCSWRRLGRVMGEGERCGAWARRWGCLLVLWHGL